MGLLKTKWFYGGLLVVAALLNAAGYALNLWREATIFDEVVHFFTTFVVTAAIGRLVVATRSVPNLTRLGVLMIASALFLGIAWEGFEWLIGIIGATRDTVMDLIMDMVGAVFAALLIVRVFGESHMAQR